MSADPMAGAASKAPSALMSTTFFRPAFSKKRFAMLWYLRESWPLSEQDAQELLAQAFSGSACFTCAPGHMRQCKRGMHRSTYIQQGNTTQHT
eukprot:scaffold31383_cov18-Tisochrysis_lutea.AAC.4